MLQLKKTPYWAIGVAVASLAAALAQSGLLTGTPLAIVTAVASLLGFVFEVRPDAGELDERS